MCIEDVYCRCVLSECIKDVLSSMCTIVSQLHRHFRGQAGVDELARKGYVGAGGVGEACSRGGNGKHDFLVDRGWYRE